MKQKNKLKTTLSLCALFLSAAFLVFTPARPLHAAGDFLCTPSGNEGAATGTNDLYNCVTRIYQVSVVAASIGAVFMIIIAGYLYMFSGGNESRTGTAKDLISSSVTGIVILLAGLLLLKQINPELLRLKPISPQKIANQEWKLPGSTGAVGGTPTGGTTPGGGQPAPVTASGCSNKESGSCTKATISACPQMAQNMDAALRACNQESSGGRPGIASGTDKCTETTTNQVVSFSWGLWQLNIVAGSTQPEFSECAGVLKTAGGPWGSKCLSGTCGRQCTFGSGGKAAFDKCTTALKDPSRNTKQACKLFKERGWRPWPHTRNVCKLP